MDGCGRGSGWRDSRLVFFFGFVVSWCRHHGTRTHMPTPAGGSNQPSVRSAVAIPGRESCNNCGRRLRKQAILDSGSPQATTATRFVIKPSSSARVMVVCRPSAVANNNKKKNRKPHPRAPPTKCESQSHTHAVREFLRQSTTWHLQIGPRPSPGLRQMKSPPGLQHLTARPSYRHARPRGQEDRSLHRPSYTAEMADQTPRSSPGMPPEVRLLFLLLLCAARPPSSCG